MGTHSLAGKIRFLAKQGLTKAAIAKECGCSTRYVAKVKNRPAPHELRKLAEREIQDRLNSGETPTSKEVAAKVGCSISLVKSILPEVEKKGASQKQMDYIEQLIAEMAIEDTEPNLKAVDEIIGRYTAKQVAATVNFLKMRRDYIKAWNSPIAQKLAVPILRCFLSKDPGR